MLRSVSSSIRAFTLIAFLQNWNNFLLPLVITTSKHLMMISPGLASGAIR